MYDGVQTQTGGRDGTRGCCGATRDISRSTWVQGYPGLHPGLIDNCLFFFFSSGSLAHRTRQSGGEFKGSVSRASEYHEKAHVSEGCGHYTPEKIVFPRSCYRLHFGIPAEETQIPTPNTVSPSSAYNCFAGLPRHRPGL